MKATFPPALLLRRKVRALEVAVATQGYRWPLLKRRKVVARLHLLRSAVEFFRN